MRAKLQEGRSHSAKILILSVIFLLLAAPLASARSFIVYNTSAPAQAYFIVNGTTGNSGIGLMNPAYPLDVSGAGRFSGNLYLGTAGRYVYDTGSVIGVSSGLSLGGNIDLGGNNLTNYNYLYSNDSAKLNGQSSSYYLDTSSTAQTKSGSLTVTGAWLNATNLNVSSNAYFGGNVGIGTASPTEQLHVAKNGNTSIYLKSQVSGTDDTFTSSLLLGGYASNWFIRKMGSANSHRLDIGYNTGSESNFVTILGSGNVGIGTTNPVTPLVINSSTPVIRYERNGVFNSYVGVSNGADSILSGDVADDFSIRSSVGNLLLGTGNTPAIFVNKTNQNVGIGTASPGARLDTQGMLRVTSLTSTPTSGRGLELWFETDTNYSSINSYNRGVGSLPIKYSAYNHTFQITGVPKMVIDNNGNVGIGTTNPLGVFHTKASTSIFLEWTGTDPVRLNPYGAGYAGVGPSGSVHSLILGNSTTGYGTGIYYDPPNRHGGLYLYSEDGAYLPLISMKAGNVGIGTTSPQNKLNVIGDINVTQGSLYTDYGVQIKNLGGWSPLLFRTGTANTNWYVYSAHGGYGAENLVLHYNNTGTPQMFITSTGNVGIGDTDPTEGKLVVNGNIGFTSATATSARINSGSYTGDGTANRAIAHGLGITPKMITVVTDYSGTGRSLYLRPGYWNYFSATENNVMTAVTAADATNFYVSSNYYANNQNTANYWWVAYG